MLVDLQEDFWPDDVASTAPELPGRIASLLSYARSNSLTVIHVRAQFAADGSDWMARYRLRGRIPCIGATPGADPLPFAVEIDGEPVVLKQSFDGFLNTELHALLSERNIRGLLIAGLVTSTCVLFTASTATQLGYLATVLGDCCSDFADAHTATLAAYPFVFDVVDSTDIANRRADWDIQLATMYPPTRS